MPDDLLAIRQTAAYLGLSVAGVKHHIYVSRTLIPDGKFGPQVYFTRPTLDAFRAEPSHRGRPTATNLKGQTLAWLQANAGAYTDPGTLARACAVALHHPRWVKHDPPDWVLLSAVQAITNAASAMP